MHEEQIQKVYSRGREREKESGKIRRVAEPDPGNFVVYPELVFLDQV